MPVHHLTRKRNCLPCRHVRILRHNKGNQIIGIPLYRNPCYGKAPQRIPDIFYKHDP